MQGDGEINALFSGIKVAQTPLGASIDYNVVVVCRSAPSLICRCTPSSHKTGRVVSRHASQAICLVIKWLTIYNNQHAGTIPARRRGLFGWWGKPECLDKTHRKLVQNRKNRVDITKHKCRDIGLPDGMVVANIQAAQRGMGQRELSSMGTLYHC